MTTPAPPDPVREMRDWWHTSIIDMQPGIIRFRGYAIEDLIGRVDVSADDLAPDAWRAAERARRPRCSMRR